MEAQGTVQERSGWVGWIGFAGVMMVIGGALNMFWGFIALVNDEWVVWGERGAVYFDVSTWGMFLLILGAVVLLAGIGVFSGNILARTIGVVIAMISMFVNFLILPLYPIWALIIITVDALIIWALMVHGREMKA